MTNRSSILSLKLAVQVVLSLVAIMAGIFTGIVWLSAAGGAALGWVVSSALLKGPVRDPMPPLRRVMLPLSAIVLMGFLMLALVLFGIASYILLPALAVGVAATFLALTDLMRCLRRLNNQ